MRGHRRNRAIAFVALGLGILLLQGAGLEPTLRFVWDAQRAAGARERELAEIRELNRLDVAATLSGDLEPLIDACADDIARLQQC